jgi:hypothetical protein
MERDPLLNVEFYSKESQNKPEARVIKVWESLT